MSLDYIKISYLNLNMKKSRKKPSNKDLLYNIALNKRMLMELQQRLIWLEEVISKYIEMKKDTKKFNKYLQDQINKEADETQQ